MQKKIPSLDLARGFTVLAMAPVHTVLLYSTLSVHHSWLGCLLAFVAEGPGAQLFMLLMGVFFVFSMENKPFSAVGKRAITLLILAYALNVVKFVIPLVHHSLPVALMTDLGVGNGPPGILRVFLTGDILHFAAISLIILYVVSRLPAYPLYAYLLAVIVCFVSPVCWDLHSGNPALNYLMQLVGGQPPKVFFPLFPWLTYPLLGAVIGHALKHHPRAPNFALLGIEGIILVGMYHAAAAQDQSAFYRPDPDDVLYHTGIVFICLWAWQWISRHISGGWFFRLLTYLSRNITQVYCIQWILIFALLPVFGYQDLGLLASVGCIILTTTITLWLSITFNLLRPRRARRP